MGKEYATKDWTIERILKHIDIYHSKGHVNKRDFVFITIILIMWIAGAWYYILFIDNQPTLTQLAEAEGWEVECVNESQEYFILDLGCDEGKVVVGSPWIKLSEKCAKPLCYEYALRRHD